ncbi:MAG: hypothetical protein IJ666_08510 [Ruminococcus sp.]|nr:hypothetical protein [Ruminococcus sp.]
MKRIYGAINTFAGIMIIILMILSFSADMKYGSSPYTDAVSYKDGWTYDNDEPVSIESIDSERPYIQKFISSDELNGQSICFISRNANFSVYLDDDEIYDFNPGKNYYKRGRYGDYMHIVPVPHFDGEKLIKIEFHNLDSNVSVGLYEMTMQNSGSYLAGLAQRDKVKFLVCFMTFLIGIIIFAYGIVEQLSHGNMTETVCLGCFTMLIGIWTSPKQSILFLLAGNSMVLRAVEYIALAIIPIPVITFAASVIKKFRNPMFITCITASTINLIAQFIIAGADVLDYKEMLFFSHIIIIACLLCIFIMLSSAYRRKEIDVRSTSWLAVSMSLILVSGIFDMLRYYFIHGMDSSKITRIVMPVFVTALIIYEVKKCLTSRLKAARQN